MNNYIKSMIKEQKVTTTVTFIQMSKTTILYLSSLIFDDGSLEMTELSAGLGNSGLTGHQIEALFFALDANADGKVQCRAPIPAVL